MSCIYFRQKLGRPLPHSTYGPMIVPRTINEIWGTILNVIKYSTRIYSSAMYVARSM